MKDNPIAADLFVAAVAKVCHEANRAWCEINGDYSQPCWEGAPAWQRTSEINGVLFNIRNPDVSPAASHRYWLAEKKADGWVYGLKKDPERKTHPLMVAYDELPEVQRRKNALFQAVVRALSR